MQGRLALAGTLGARRLRRHAPLAWKLRNLPHVVPGLLQCGVRRLLRMSGLEGRLYVRHFTPGGVVDYGLVSTHIITTAFVEFMVAQLQAETSEWGDFKYHDSGVGTGDELVGNVGLGSPWGGARSEGTQIEGASAEIYKSVATTAYNNIFAITEHGLFSQAAGTTLMDRHLFAAINVVSGDSIQFTYELTCTAGG